MKQYIIAIACIASLSVHAQRTVTLTMIPYPLTAQDVTTLLEDVKKPGRLSREQMEALLQPASVNGIFTSYIGFLEPTNNQGMVSFVRKLTNVHKLANPEFYLVLTTDIKPIRTFGMTVHHWELDSAPGKKADAAFFMVKREIEGESGTCYWNVQKVAKPENNIIPLEAAIIIFAHPKSIFVPEGATACTDAGENLLLPPIYIRKGIKTVRNAIDILPFSHFYRPEQEAIKKGPLLLETIINEQ
jgi:hypothetical protein